MPELSLSDADRFDRTEADEKHYVKIMKLKFEANTDPSSLLIQRVD